MWSNYLDYLINFVGTPTCLFTFQGSQQEPLASSKRSSGCASGLMESQLREFLIPKQVLMDKSDKVRINDDWWQNANVLYSIESYTYSIHVKINFDQLWFTQNRDDQSNLPMISHHFESPKTTAFQPSNVLNADLRFPAIWLVPSWRTLNLNRPWCLGCRCNTLCMWNTNKKNKTRGREICKLNPKTQYSNVI